MNIVIKYKANLGSWHDCVGLPKSFEVPSIVCKFIVCCQLVKLTLETPQIKAEPTKEAKVVRRV